LVIIGLIVGGILTSQNMIKAAEIRATVSQMEQYSVAANTFRNKYNYLPGDLSGNYDTQFGFIPRSGAAGHGDGNGVLEGCSSAAVGTLSVFGCEIGMFWTDLSSAKLIAEEFSSATDDLLSSCANADACTTFVPITKLGRGSMFTVFGSAGRNYYEIHSVTAITTGTGAYTLANTMSPQEGFNIDDKLDDGKPLTGIVRAMTGSTTTVNTTAVPAIAAIAVCVENTNNDYNTTTEDYANSPACGLRLLMQ
jgi:hypothetical protein